MHNADKIRYVLVIGDNGTKNYDEPTSMKLDLILGEVPDSVIFLDYAFVTEKTLKIDKQMVESRLQIHPNPFTHSVTRQPQIVKTTNRTVLLFMTTWVKKHLKLSCDL